MTALSRSAATAVSALPAAARAWGPRRSVACRNAVSAAPLWGSCRMRVLLHAAVAAMMASAAFSVAHAQARGWSTAQLSQARFIHAATSVGTVAIFAGGNFYGKLLNIVVDVLRGHGGSDTVSIVVVSCVMETWLFVFRVAVQGRLLSYARHCRNYVQCCGLVRQWNRTLVDGSAQSGARFSFSDICWNGGHLRWGVR